MHTTAHAHPIERAQKLLSTQPLLAVDSALAAFGATRNHRSDSETTHYLEILSRALCGACGCAVAKHGDPIEAMLTDHGCDSLACAALLRLLVLDDIVFAETRMRGAIALFDRALAGRLYKGLDLTAKAQPFEKRERLRSRVAEHELALQTHIDSLGSLDALPEFRQQLSQLFKDQVTQVAIRPFLPAGTTVQTLNEVLAAVEQAATADDEQLLERAEIANTRCAALAERAAATPTVYSIGLLGTLADNLRELVRAEIRLRGLADPGVVRLETVDKRYPLREVGASVVLHLDVVNDGPGQTREVTVTLDGHEHVTFEDSTRTLGLLAPGTKRVSFRGTVTAPASSDAVLVRLTWRDPDGGEREDEHIIELPGHDVDIPWAALEDQPDHPYPLEPVEAGRFVGRQAVLRDLTKIVVGTTPGNARVVGQRRVGKTSIAKALVDRVEQRKPGVYSFLAIEAGDFNANTPAETVARLGEMIVSMVKASDPRFAGIEIPSFEPGLSPLTECFAQAALLAPDRRFIVLLDEFDFMPHPELYERGAIGSAFFQTLRSLGGKPNVGFILIGGERMRFIIATHGQALNKFQLVPVDYFDEEHYDDYIQLLRDPVSEWLEISDDAVRALYDATAGNPWLTKLVAREMYARAIAGRDADIRSHDMELAIEAELPKLGASSFQHFWDDAIQGGADEQEHVSVARRKVLLALAAVIRARQPLTEVNISRAARAYDIDEASANDVLRGFQERAILLTGNDGELRCRVPLLARWLADEGVNEIVVTLGDDDALVKRQRALEALRPKTPELEALAARWRTYRGQLIAPSRIRSWLNQFGQPRDQRLMLQLLQALRYVNAADLAERLRELHDYLLRDLADAGHEYKRSGRQRFRDDILLCGLEGGGSGAAALVRPYREENKIYKDRALDHGQIPRELRDHGDHIHAVVVLEDFVATGGTARRRVTELHREWTTGVQWPDDLPVYLLAVCGFDAAVESVRKTAEGLRWNVEAHAAVQLDDSDRCFHETSTIFPDPEERERARALCADRGLALEPKYPLGYDDTEAAVCFETRCPNNSLPVLWKGAPNWEALFPRL